MSSDKHLRCSFCGKSKDSVKKFISGPSVYICNECISLCNEILSRHTGQTVQRIAEDADRDRFMSPYEAVEYGLLDRVLEGPVQNGKKPNDSATLTRE